MAGADEIGASGIVVGQRADRRGALLGRDAGRRAVPVIDRDRESGAVDRVVVGDHRREVQPARGLAGDRRADDAAGMADDERHLLGGGVDGGDDQVALVLAVVIVGDDDDLAAARRRRWLRERSIATRALFSEPVFGEEPGIALAQLQYREPPQYRTRAPPARLASLECAGAQLGGEAAQQIGLRERRRPRTAGMPACRRDAGGPYSSRSIAPISCAGASPAAASRSAIAIAVATSRSSRCRSGGSSGRISLQQHFAPERQQAGAARQIADRLETDGGISPSPASREREGPSAQAGRVRAAAAVGGRPLTPTLSPDGGEGALHPGRAASAVRVRIRSRGGR